MRGADSENENLHGGLLGAKFLKFAYENPFFLSITFFEKAAYNKSVCGFFLQ